MKTSRVENLKQVPRVCFMLLARDYTLARDRERSVSVLWTKSSVGSMLHAIVSFLANLLDRNFLSPGRVGEDQLDRGSFPRQTAITPGIPRCKSIGGMRGLW